MNNLGRGTEKKKESILSKETVGIVLVLFAAVALVILITRDVIFGTVGFAVSSFLLGLFGYCSAVVLAALIYLGVVMIVGKRLAVSAKTAGFCALCFVSLVLLVHTITSAVGGIEYTSYGEYLGACFDAGEKSYFQTTGGGAIAGLIVYPVCKLTTSVGGYILFSLMTIGFGYLVYVSVRGRRPFTAKRDERADRAIEEASRNTSDLYNLGYGETVAPYAPPTQPQQPAAPQTYAEAPVQNSYSAVDNSKRLYSINDEFALKSKRELRNEARRERQGRQQPVQNASLEDYNAIRQILYPDRPAPVNTPLINNNPQEDGYAWFNRVSGSASSPARSSSSSYSSSASSAPSGSSYTRNGIFNENSYFNRPRHAISKEQYNEAFRTDAPSSFTAGHERTVPRTPAPQEPARPAPSVQESAQPATYSEMYADDAENNISYSNKPKKIVTDASSADYSQPVRTEQPTQAATPAPAAPSVEPDYYRNDVPFRPEEEGTLSSQRPTPGFGRTEQPASDFGREEQSTSFSSRSERREKPRTESRRAASIDIGDTARMVGFGGLERSAPSAPARSETPRVEAEPARPSYTEQVPVRSEPERTALQEPVSPAREARELPPVRETRTESSFESTRSFAPDAREAAREVPPVREAREQPQMRETQASEPVADEEPSGLQPISDDFDSAVNIFDEEDEAPASSVIPDAVENISRRDRGERLDRSATRPVPEAPAEEAPRKKHVYQRYVAPPLNLLNDYPNAVGDMEEEVEHNKVVIVETLSNLKIPSEVVKVTQGPSVTRYDIDIPGNIPTSRVLSCDKELAMRLHARDGVNIQTNYENGSISIEVPNKQKMKVGLKDLLQSPSFTGAKPGALMFGLGKDIEGRAICGDIMKMKHLLVAGSTGSGKSVCLNALIISLLYKYSPEDLRIILVDPKQVEFNIYEKLPHLMINEIIFEPAKVVNVLNWAITEMERRYSLFKEKTKKGTLVREIDEYNAHLLPDEEKLPKVVMIIDELADLMSVAKKDIEDRIQRLTQKSRAAGIHLVLATQRPSVNVITGVIKSNLPTRVAFKVTQEVDSRTILDESGAEKLLGYGDMLYKTDTMTFPRRVQGALVESAEVQQVVQFVKEHNEAYFDDSVYDYINNAKSGGGVDGDGGDDGVEAVYIDALRYVVQIGQASISMIQRRCSVGYPKAGKIIEWMENMGYISAFEGAKARKVLLTPEEFESKYGDYGE